MMLFFGFGALPVGLVAVVATNNSRAGLAMEVAPPNPDAARHVHFNNAGDSPSPPRVTDAVVAHLELEARVGGYRAAELASTEVDGVYASAARLIGAGRDDGDGSGKRDAREEVALVESATVGWTRAFYSALETKEREVLARTGRREAGAGAGDERELAILASEAEYAANLVAAVKFARDRDRGGSRVRWRVLPIPSAEVGTEGGERASTGVVDLDALRSILEGTYADPSGEGSLDPASVAMVCITHIPTNSGVVNPVNEIGEMIEEFNLRAGSTSDDTSTAGAQAPRSRLPSIFYLVDACQSVGQIPVDVRAMKCHALAATGRKYLRGPRGTGFLYVRRRVADGLEPSHVDHAAAPVTRTVAERSPSSSTRGGLEGEGAFGLRHGYRPGAARFEFWEASVANRLGLGAAMDAALEFGIDAIGARCATLGGRLRERLREVEGARVHHDGSSACGIVSFVVDGLDAATVKERMQEGVREEVPDGAERPPCCYHLSVVPATSTPLDSGRTGLGERPLLRASLSYFNTEDEIESFCRALAMVQKKLLIRDT